MKHSTLKLSDLAQLWQRWRGDGCLQARARLINHYRYLPSITATRQVRNLPPALDREDLVSAGMLGLIHAVDNFQPERRIKFETYAIALIRGAMLELLRTDDWVPRSIRQQRREIEQVYGRIQLQHGRTATNAEVAGDLGISELELEKRCALFARMGIVSYEDLCDEDQTLRLIDALPSEETTPFAHLLVREKGAAIEAAISRLPEREEIIIRRYYDGGETFKVIGGHLGISESRVYQMHTQAINRLRGYLEYRAEDLLCSE